MPSDKSTRIETHRPPEWKLPEIRAVEMRAAVYEPRRARTIKGPLSATGDAVECVERPAAAVPARPRGPVTWVGDKRVTEGKNSDSGHSSGRG